MKFIEDLESKFISENILTSFELLFIVNEDDKIVYNKKQSYSIVFDKLNINDNVYIKNLFSVKIANRLYDALNVCKEKKTQTSFDFIVDENLHNFHITGTVQRFEENNQYFYLFLLKDETEKYHLRDRLNKKNIILDKIQNSIRVSYFIFDSLNEKIEFSTFTNTLLKIDQNIRLDYEAYLNLINLSDRLLIKNAFEQIKKDQIPCVLEYQLLLNGENHCRHLLYLEPIIYNSTSHVNIIGIIQDVSELRVLEEQFYRNSKAKELIVNAIPDIMFTQKYDGTFVD